MLLAALPLSLGIFAALLLGLAAGAAVNWSAYTHAWTRRAISPWSKPHPEALPRRWTDRFPLWGWFGLRREEAVHGRGFWRRPLAVELLMGVGFAALYWWEVDQQGLVARQFAELATGPLPAGDMLAPRWITLATFFAHAVLITLMAAASLIDIDEKLVPGDITVAGTLLGLVLAAAMPMGLLPHVFNRLAAPAVGVEVILPAAVAPQQGRVFVEPMTPSAPNEWPTWMSGGGGLAVGLACYASWCAALTPRIWRRRRGMWFGLKVLASRVVRELTRPPLSWIGLVGGAAIVSVWALSASAWVGLLSALVGMLGAGAMVWAVRIAGTSALRREAMGFGDVTFMMMVGAYLGWQAGIVIFFLAPIAGLAVGLIQLVLRRDDVIPYVPYLAMASLAVMVRWADVWNARLGGLQDMFGLPWLIPAVLAICVVMLWAALVLWRNTKEALFGSE
jgi:prepilin signal peptidase PulO-like enzyme (type II secretory pathway)